MCDDGGGDVGLAQLKRLLLSLARRERCVFYVADKQEVNRKRVTVGQLAQ